MQIRVGPAEFGAIYLIQPFADVLKLLIKEIILPDSANKFLFELAPIIPAPGTCTGCLELSYQSTVATIG
jgi:NADH:ubiquinone oxidoreductase subunit H